MDVSTLADQVFFTTAYLAGSDETKQWSGTGFCLAVETDQGTAHLLVSNKHVLELAQRLLVRMVQRDGEAPMIGPPDTGRTRDFAGRAPSTASTSTDRPHSHLRHLRTIRVLPGGG